MAGAEDLNSGQADAARGFDARTVANAQADVHHLSTWPRLSPAARRLIATALLAWTGSGYSVALYVLLSCIISIAATIPLPDYTNRDISEEPVYELAESAVPAGAAPSG
jgi:hypothetical protein